MPPRSDYLDREEVVLSRSLLDLVGSLGKLALPPLLVDSPRLKPT
jgi:hypothetical protein